MIPKVPHSEKAIVFRLLAYCCLAGASYTLAKTAGDTLFLSRIGSASLSYVFLASGLVTAVLASLWFNIARRFSIDRFLLATSLVLGIAFLTAWWLLPRFHHSFFFLAGIYVLAEVKGCLYAINVIAGMNETMGGRSTRESWAVVLLGFPVAAIAVGLLVGIESVTWGTRTWLLLSGVIDLIGSSSAFRLKRHALRRDASGQIHSADSGPNVTSELAKASLPLTQYVRTKAFGQWFAVLVAAKVVVLTLLSFNWKVTTTEFFGGREDLLAEYFGLFYAVAGAATLLVQFFITGRLLSRKRVFTPILVLPLALLVLNLMFIGGCGFGLSVAFLFYVVTAAKSLDAWRRSTHDTAIHLLYTEVEKGSRRGLIGRNHAFVKPVAEIATAITLLPGLVWLQNVVLLVATSVWLYATASVIGIVRRRKRRRIHSRTKESNSSTAAPSTVSNHAHPAPNRE